MKHHIHLIIILLIPLLFASCEKVINANLKASEKKYVIEGIVNNSDADTCTIWISATSSFSEDNKFHGLSGALVQVSDNNGPPVTLAGQDTGIYQSLLVKGVPGHSYHLQVTIAGNVYTADCTMPQQVGFDSLFVTRQDVAGKYVYLANVIYNDPPAITNYYNFVQYVNRKRMADLYINSDDLSDGRTVQYTLYNNAELEADDNFDVGDTLVVEMQCIDAAMYRYLYSLNAGASGSDVLATPANPVTNLNGDVLGYFSANTSQRRSLIVQ